MFLINGITDQAAQTQILTLQDGSQANIQISFSPSQLGWFIDNLTYGDFVLNCMRISLNPNILYPWKNIIPFGLGVYSTINREPMFQEDFASGAIQLYLLTPADVASFTRYVQSGGQQF